MKSEEKIAVAQAVIDALNVAMRIQSEAGNNIYATEAEFLEYSKIIKKELNDDSIIPPPIQES